MKLSRSCNPWNPDRFRNVNPDGNPNGNDNACNPFNGLAVDRYGS